MQATENGDPLNQEEADALIKLADPNDTKRIHYE